MNPSRLIEVDILRVIAILAIVAGHIQFHTPGCENSSIVGMIELLFAVCGLSLFFFLSGYSLMIKKPEFSRFNELKSYSVRRVARIYPLYWLALLITLVIQPDAYDELTTLQKVIDISGLQILFPDPIVWFVSAIVVFYILFPLFILFARMINRPYRMSIFLAALTIFIILATARIASVSIDDRVFIYYWFFVSGVILGRETSISSIRISTRMMAAVLAGIGCLAVYILARNMMMVHLEPMWEPISSLPKYVAMSVVGVIGILLAIQFTNSFKGCLTKSMYQLVERLAHSTYSIYLFHSYFLSIAAIIATELSPVLVPYSVIAVGIPLAILIPPYIQDLMEYTLSALAGVARSKT